MLQQQTNLRTEAFRTRLWDCHTQDVSVGQRRCSAIDPNKQFSSESHVRAELISVKEEVPVEYQLNHLQNISGKKWKNPIA